MDKTKLTDTKRYSCWMCGNAFAKHNKDNGLPARSLNLTHIDKRGLFCTMRCAAKYAVLQAEHHLEHMRKRAAI